MWEDYDKEMFNFNGSWGADSRVCLQSQAPKPATITAISMSLRVNEKL